MYPKHDIDPKLKNSKWILQYVKAAWNDSESHIPEGIWYRGRDRYDEIDSYVLGKQSIDKYKKQFSNDDDADTTWTKIDWSVRPVVSKFRDIAIAKVLQRELNIMCTPIDPMAKDDADKYFADIRTKILMRQALKQANPELAESAELAPAPGEPEDLEELEMQMNFGFKHNMAIEAEQGIQLVMYQNKANERRKRLVECLFDYGVGGYKECIEDGKVKYREVNPKHVITNYSHFGDFSDLRHVGEVVFMTLEDLSKYYEEKDLDRMASTYQGQYGNPRYINLNGTRTGWDKFKIPVLDFEFYSWNTKVRNRFVNSAGNLSFKNSSFENRSKQDVVEINGETIPKYVSRTIKVVYKCKWVIGTDFIFEDGLATYMKRTNQNPGDTSLSYHLYAYNFKDMRAQGVMEKLIPIIDEYHLTIYKIQNFKVRYQPYIMKLDLDALENVSLAKGGTPMSPKDLLKMALQTNIMAMRHADLSGANVNYKPIEIFPTGMAEEFGVLVNDLERLKNEIREISGLNEATDASTINPKTLNGAATLMNESTNNALYPIIQADKNLTERLAKALIERLCILVKMGKVEGVVHALGMNTVKFISVSPDLPLHDYGIMVEFVPNDQERQILMEKLNIKDAQGLIEPEDFVLIQNTRNTKQAAQILAYKVKKRREAMQMESLQLQQANTESQVQSAQAVEQSKQQTLQMEYALKMQLMDAEMQWKYKIEELKISGAAQNKLLEQSQIGAMATGQDAMSQIQG